MALLEQTIASLAVARREKCHRAPVKMSYQSAYAYDKFNDSVMTI